MNTLTIIYKSGESRILHPTKDFFVTGPTSTKKPTWQKDKILSIANKCMDIAEGLGPYVYKVLLDREGQVQFERTIHANEPTTVVKQVQGVKTRKIDETRVKRQLWNESKNQILKTILHGTF